MSDWGEVCEKLWVIFKSGKKIRQDAFEQKVLQHVLPAIEYASYMDFRWPELEERVLASDSHNITRYAQRVIKGRWIEGEQALLSNFPSGWLGYLFGLKTLHSPELEERLLAAFSESRDDLYEIQSVTSQYLQLRQERWPEIEPFLLLHRFGLTNYAKNNIKGRWLEAEPAILLSAWESSNYAYEILKDRWVDAEKTILTSSSAASSYARQVLKHRWTEAEDRMLKEQNYMEAVNYAFNMIGGRWKRLEDAMIAEKPNLHSLDSAIHNYLVIFIRQRWPEVEHIILRSVRHWYWYVNTYVERRIPEWDHLLREHQGYKHYLDRYKPIKSISDKRKDTYFKLKRYGLL